MRTLIGNSEEENELLAAVNLEAVNVTDKIDKVVVEKADRSTEVNKHRFVNLTSELQRSLVKLSV